MTITVYSKPACVACSQTYKALDRKGAHYEVLDITKDENAYSTVKDLGYMQAPVVVVEKDGVLTHWSGFSLEKINAEL